VARYVGNNRTRSQCSQRWQRGLDPRISRSRWTPEDEARLIGLVEKYGEKSVRIWEIEVMGSADIGITKFERAQQRKGRDSRKSWYSMGRKRESGSSSASIQCRRSFGCCIREGGNHKSKLRNGRACEHYLNGLHTVCSLNDQLLLKHC
jgi:hypothetical protein